jgi:cobyrinic acid a,c-diamide synthase
MVGCGGLIIAAPASAGGKTVVTLAVLRALTRAGIRVNSFKIGPDYIDPAFHTAATARPCPNLDPWAMRPATIAHLLERLSVDADLVIGEGVMGLFDGAADGTGSTADVAAATGWPVILVVDVRGQAASAAAVVRGFASHRTDITVAGVILNRVGGPAHIEILRRAMAPLGVIVLGCLPRDEAFALPQRHLGLVQAAECDDLQPFFETAADFADRCCDLAMLRSLARPARSVALSSATGGAGVPPLGQRIAVACDVAFAFAYPTQLDMWRAAGATLSPFSPLADEAPATDADAIFLPGGYPELHAGRLAASPVFLGGLRTAAARGATIYGECGGYMTLGESVIDADGQPHAMAGLLPLTTSFAERRLHLGYRQVRLATSCALGSAGSDFRGHEFHYAVIRDEGTGEPLFQCRDARGNRLGGSGRRRGSVMGSFVHLIDRIEDGAIEVAG